MYILNYFYLYRLYLSSVIGVCLNVINHNILNLNVQTTENQNRSQFTRKVEVLLNIFVADTYAVYLNLYPPYTVFDYFL